MNRPDIEKTDSGNITYFHGYKHLLVTFGGIHQGLGIPVFEFLNSISDIPCDKILFRDFNQAWYQKGVDAEVNHIDKVIDFLKQKIKQYEYTRICFMGNSMGGYAAILFGCILNIDVVISFAPQSFIDRFHRFIYRDHRWPKEISRIHSYTDKRSIYFDLKKYLSKNPSYKTKLNIYYSMNDQLDKKHAERLKQTNNVILHSLPEGGHLIVKNLRNTGELKSIIQSAFKPGISDDT